MNPPRSRLLRHLLLACLSTAALSVAVPWTRVAQASPAELGRAVASVDSDPAAAARSLRELRDEMPWLDDVIDYYAALAAARSDGAAGRRALDAFLAAHASSVLAPDATAALARLVEEAGDTARAVSLADRDGREGQDGSSEAAAVCLSAGRLLAAKEAGRAMVYLQCARTKAPLSNAARAAWDEVVVLRAKHRELRPSTAQALMAEARLLGREGRGAEQVATLRELLTEHPGSTYESEAEIVYGRALGRVESKAAGAAFFEKKAAGASGARKAKLLYEAATLRWNDDRNDEATALFERMLALKAGGADDQQAMYALARIDDSAGRRADAIRWYGRAAAAAKGATKAESQWRQGWVSYRARDFATAEKTFAAMAEGAPRGSDTDGRAEALYWQGRSLERLDRDDEARACFSKVLAEFPAGYYAAAAEKRLGRRTRLPVAQPDASKADLPPAAALAIRRARTLREAGLAQLAARDLAMRLDRFDAATRRAALPALPSAGAWDAALKIAAKMSDSGQLSREQARAYLYPRAYADIVEKESRAVGIDPTLVYALMRQESAFDPGAVSSAKALGLMQMLESTAKKVAAAYDLPEPSAEDLFDPAVNIRLGVRYLAQLSKLFDGSTPLMAASYNAGEAAAERWKELAAKWDEDEMIEQISYRETRGYVKNVLRNMRNYRSMVGE